MRYSVWYTMIMYGELKKAAEKNHDKLKLVCVLVENRFKQVYYISKMCYCRKQSAYYLCYGFLRKVVVEIDVW
jgi:hypothetical protein